MLAQILVAATILLAEESFAYNEDSPNYKWSPNYFGVRAPAPIVYSSRLSNLNLPRRVIAHLYPFLMC